MRGQGNSLARAKALYDRSVTPRRTRQMRDLLNESEAETAAYAATTVLCQYLNRWDDAGPAEVERAEAAIARAFEHNPQFFLAHYAKGFLYRARGEHQASLDAFDEAIKQAPEFARAYAQKGEELVYLGQAHQGITQVERALELSPSSSVRGYFYWVIGRARFFLEEDSEAISWLQRSVRNWPNVWYNRLYLISAHAHSKNRVAAGRVLRAFTGMFGEYSLAQVVENEGATPNEHPFVTAGRDRFHEGLRLAGMR